ncbi:hypothetical protein GGS24DRAFT_504623 [Hypoxylon argillaceum]|nr:hypothetical protein GGS24DRAFT_504623 [Hypoxylon argillaceum]
MPKDRPLEPTRQTHARRKSSGTIDLLIETRRRASSEHARATRAENAYRARKNATIARTTLRETRGHFREGFAHLGLGLKGMVAVARAAPYLVSERREAWRRRREGERRARAEEMRRRRIEERLAKGYGEGGEMEKDEGGKGESVGEK